MATPSIGSVGEKLDLLIKQGSTFGPFEVALQNPDLTAVDLTGSVFRAQIRKKRLDGVIVASMTTAINPDQVGAGKGKFTFGMDAATTTALVAGELLNESASVYVWDMEWQDSSGRILPLYLGTVKIQSEVTRV